jgi:hypothetical protein
MAQKKEGTESTEKKPGVKIQDLTPSKDAKGGVARNADSVRNADKTRNADGLPSANTTKTLD